MRMLPSRYFGPDKPVVAKKDRALLVHVSPPIKGMAENAKTQEADAKFAGVLVNMYADDDRLTVRAGHRKIASMTGGAPVEHIIPYYGQPERLAAATGNTLCDAETGILWKAGFTSNDWHWTAFSDLGALERTCMVNGSDGVWTWDGGTDPSAAPLTVTTLAKATPPATDAVVTVASGIGTLAEGDGVIFAGANAAHANANGPQRIVSVNNPPGTFALSGVDSSGWGADQTTGSMTVTEQGSFVKEAVTPPPGNTWLSTDELSIVIAHQNRLFFADETNLAVYYLPIQQRYGELKILPLNAIFKRGGTIRAMNTWTVDGGMGMDDQLVVFSTNGEVAIYSGVDPADDFRLVGVFRLEPPLSKWCTLNYGGELYCLIPTGLTPMSTVLKSGREGLEASDKTVVSFFLRNAVAYRDNPGWELYINPNTGRVMCNIPRGGGNYTQMVRTMAKPAWTEFRGIPARCWAWVEPYNYFGDDRGNVYQMHPTIQNDDGKQIMIDVQTAWSQFKTPAIKHFKMILPYVITDGFPNYSLDLRVDYDNSGALNIPDVTMADPRDATWDVTAWDEEYWVSGTNNWANWTGVGSIGRVGAIRMTAGIANCTFQILGWDVLYDRGSVFG